MTSGTSAAVVSRIGLPLSIVSASASRLSLPSSRSAILFRSLARCAGAVLPQALARRMRGVEREFDILRRRARHLAERLAGDRADIVEILAFDRRDPFAADEIVIAFAERDLLLQFLKALREHISTSLPYSGLVGAHYRLPPGRGNRPEVLDGAMA